MSASTREQHIMDGAAFHAGSDQAGGSDAADTITNRLPLPSDTRRLYSAAMRLSKMIQVVRPELARYPQQMQGSPQNLFRMVHRAVRMNDLERRSQVGSSARDAFESAVAFVQRQWPGFSPTAAIGKPIASA